jgi:hypothetical protein
MEIKPVVIEVTPFAEPFQPHVIRYMNKKEKRVLFGLFTFDLWAFSKQQYVYSAD